MKKLSNIMLVVVIFSMIMTVAGYRIQYLNKNQWNIGKCFIDKFTA